MPWNGPVDLVGATGADGDAGRDGAPGIDGDDGEPGMFVPGLRGADGADGAGGSDVGFLYTYSTDTTHTDPTGGHLKFDSVTFGSITEIVISAEDGDANDILAWLAEWSPNPPGTVPWGTIFLRKVADASTFAIFALTGTSGNIGVSPPWNYYSVTVSSSGGTFSDGDAVRIYFIRAGVKGATGSTGATGSAGSNGTNGRDGVPGFDGEDGEPGFFIPGRDGATGPAGSAGATGSAGSDGATGRDGIPGRDGEDGEPGFFVPGPRGEQGVAGNDGADGANGNDGAPGADGATGRDGIPGFGGEDGEPGFFVPGPRGADGAAGSTGATGSTGSAGAAGSNGRDGAPGFGGEDGETQMFLPPSFSGRDDLIVIQDQKSAGTSGGTFTSGARRTRDLNTLVTDTGGNVLSFASNQFQLRPGTYDAWIAAPASFVDQHQAWLWNVTASADQIRGTTEWSAQGGGVQVDSKSLMIDRFTIASDSVFEVRHRCSSTDATYGFGVGLNNSWDTCVFTVVILRRIK